MAHKKNGGGDPNFGDDKRYMASSGKRSSKSVVNAESVKNVVSAGILKRIRPPSDKGEIKET